MFHISRAYSWMVRSLLNLDEPAVFNIDIFVHFCTHVSYENVNDNGKMKETSLKRLRKLMHKDLKCDK
jgi:hypothetical protein